MIVERRLSGFLNHLEEKSHPLSAIELMHLNSLFLSVSLMIELNAFLSCLYDSGLAVVVLALYTFIVNCLLRIITFLVLYFCQKLCYATSISNASTSSLSACYFFPFWYNAYMTSFTIRDKKGGCDLFK